MYLICAQKIYLVYLVILFAYLAVDKSLSQSLDDARDAMMYSAVDMLTAYGSTQVPQSGRVGQLPICFSLRMVPLFVMAMLKYVSEMSDGE